jgi:hypothetical protein
LVNNKFLFRTSPPAHVEEGENRLCTVKKTGHFGKGARSFMMKFSSISSYLKELIWRGFFSTSLPVFLNS